MRQTLMLTLLATACGTAASDIPDAPIVPTGPVETYGFVTTLGEDTVAAERVTWGTDAMVSESVDRWPVVRLRHTELAIAPDGRPTRLRMEVRTPNAATPAERWRMVLARFTADSVIISIEDSSGTNGRSFATGGALTVPHVSMQYSIIEYEIAASLALGGRTTGDTLLFRQFYPDRDIGPRFVLHRGRVIPAEGDHVVLRHDWLSGAGDAVVDSSRRMLAYSGQRSTYKVEVERTDAPPDVAAIGTALAAAERSVGPARLSVRDSALGTIGAATLRVDYGRPLRRGRVLLGNVIDYDRVWRTGANEATEFTTSAPITLAGLELPAGSYSLWTVPRRDGAELIVNRETGQWGTGYDGAQNLGVAAMATEELSEPVEEFTIRFEARDAGHGNLVLEWGTFRWTAPIEVR